MACRFAIHLPDSETFRLLFLLLPASFFALPGWTDALCFDAQLMPNFVSHTNLLAYVQYLAVFTCCAPAPLTSFAARMASARAYC